jgi:proteasome lid subunit RPN8/RPN11
MLKIPKPILSAIWDHAEHHYPNESAGVILGQVEADFRIAEATIPLKNNFRQDSRHNRYLIRPEDMLEVEQSAEKLGLDVIGVFHSHPDHPAKPSDYDREWALPWYSYLITSIRRGNVINSRSWRLSDKRQFSEEELQILDRILPEEAR